MKRTRFAATASLVLSICLIAFVPTTYSQGTTFLSNLDETTSGGFLVGYPQRLAQPFYTGFSSSAFNLDSIQIAMDDASANVVGFSLSVHRDHEGMPGDNLGHLIGSTNPALAGIYSYTASGITLSPATAYWIVAASDSSAIGFCVWKTANSTNYISNDGWSIKTEMPYGLIMTSVGVIGNGIAPLQFAMNATPVPEPQIAGLCGLFLMAILQCRKTGRCGEPEPSRERLQVVSTP